MFYSPHLIKTDLFAFIVLWLAYVVIVMLSVSIRDRTGTSAITMKAYRQSIQCRAEATTNRNVTWGCKRKTCGHHFRAGVGGNPFPSSAIESVAAGWLRLPPLPPIRQQSTPIFIVNFQWPSLNRRVGGTDRLPRTDAPTLLTSSRLASPSYHRHPTTMLSFLVSAVTKSSRSKLPRPSVSELEIEIHDRWTWAMVPTRELFADASK